MKYFSESGQRDCKRKTDLKEPSHVVIMGADEKAPVGRASIRFNETLHTIDDSLLDGVLHPNLSANSAMVKKFVARE